MNKEFFFELNKIYLCPVNLPACSIFISTSLFKIFSASLDLYCLIKLSSDVSSELISSLEFFYGFSFITSFGSFSIKDTNLTLSSFSFDICISLKL